MTDDPVSELAQSSAVGIRSAIRSLRRILGDGIQASGDALPLERQSSSSEPASIVDVSPLERGTAPIAVTEHAPSRIAAFLDGVQRTRVLTHVHGVPIIYATVASVVRERTNRKLSTWREPHHDGALHVPRAHVDHLLWDALSSSGVPLIDVCAADGDALAIHPMAIRERTMQMVGAARDNIERELAIAWCEQYHTQDREGARWLWIDGGISGNATLTESSPAFGVVKSHSNLYGTDESIRAVLTMRLGERSPAFLVEHRRRRAFASWYLRVREAPNGDPFFGLVRVEIAPASEPVTSRANTLSSWILSESAPLSLPDSRWDVLTYGIHDCELYLKALLGA